MRRFFEFKPKRDPRLDKLDTILTKNNYSPKEFEIQYDIWPASSYDVYDGEDYGFYIVNSKCKIIEQDVTTEVKELMYEYKRTFNPIGLLNPVDENALRKFKKKGGKTHRINKRKSKKGGKSRKQRKTNKRRK